MNGYHADPDSYTKRDCSHCYNCDSLHGFMASCHVSYDEVREDGSKWHVQCGQDVRRDHAVKCPHYTEKAYARDEFFVL